MKPLCYHRHQPLTRVVLLFFFRGVAPVNGPKYSCVVRRRPAQFENTRGRSNNIQARLRRDRLEDDYMHNILC